MKRVLIPLAVCVLALAAAVPVLADDFANGNGANAAPNWKVYSLSSSGQTYATKGAQASNGGIGFDFMTTPNTRLFMTTHPGDLLGDLTGKTITATFTIVGSSPAFTYYGEGQTWNPCGTPASVRLYFEGNTNGPFTNDTAGYSKYWWSNPGSATLTSVVGATVTLNVPLTTAEWSDWGGEPASTVASYFNEAVADVSGIGLSFGGGCFFANGVGLTSGGPASFVLTSFSVG